ncbi:transcriptional regulator [Aureimonas endophytica]|uniref:Transcriptional regulator n=1 Tax=Aureimonas endophytica TaxID=2027858 RepID=A0A916ZNK9_9HYPH|nr:YafY family protein [Aureimonas endophytica]GGE06223.1 transcriptional regulator [Aureimonas endophytica]
MARTARIFELLVVLRARRAPVTASELARELGVSPRSIYRDIETLRAIGAPVDGEAGVGYLLKQGFFLPEFAFSIDELDALALGLGWVQQRADPVLARCSESALAKILAVRANGPPPNEGPPAIVPAASVSERLDPPQAAVLREAIRRQRKVRIQYADAFASPSERIVWPIVIVYFDDVRVLAAWCELRSAFRHFRVDRLEVQETLDERYPGRRQSIMTRWQQQDRDWRTLLTVSDAAQSYPSASSVTSAAMSKES